MTFAAYLCSQRGYHLRNGASTGTATVIWSPWCATCGAWIGRPAPAEDGGSQPKETEQSAA